MSKKHDPEVEQQEEPPPEVTPPEVGIPPDFGDGSNVPDEGIRHRGIPPAPPMDAPIPPQDVEKEDETPPTTEGAA